jgi:kynurenine formamidase
MRLIDLSQPVFDGCPNCPAHPPVRVTAGATHEKDGWRLELLSFASHTGSHVDAPLHKLAGGASLDQMPLDRFVGEAFVVDLRDATPSMPITAEVLSKRLTGRVTDRIVLLATGWGERRQRTDEWFYRSPFLSTDGAQWLVERRVRGVGIDHYSISGAAEPNNARVHEILLGGGTWIVEELKFPPEVFSLPQPVNFWSLPVNFKGFSGAFCRPVIAVEDDKVTR